MIEITANGPKAEQAVKSAFAQMHRLSALFDAHSPDSEISRINRNAGGAAIPVSEDTFCLLEQAVDFARTTDGAFDPTIGPVVELWGIGRKQDYVPTDTEISKAVSLVNYRNLELNKTEKSVRLTRPGMALDLGGAAKGYILTQMVRELKRYEIASALINGGGDVRVIGRKPDGTPWRIGVQHPRSPEALLATITLDAWTQITTSGDYQRYFIKDGRRYHHIFDPRTGRPTTPLAAVTLVSGDRGSDMPSNALMVMGENKAMQFIKEFPEIEALFVDENAKLSHTDGLAGRLFKQGM